ncbi:MAG: DUF4351 domain-containing protein [Nostoc sp.]
MPLVHLQVSIREASRIQIAAEKRQATPTQPVVVHQITVLGIFAPVLKFLLFQRRFGEVPPSIAARLESKSVEQLESLMDAAIAVSFLTEFITVLFN